MDCHTCKSITGENRISPGPTIHEGRYWYVEHAYPVKMKGWLVLMLKRHAEALHELSLEEFAELASLQYVLTRLLHKEMGCEKEYVVCFAEAEHFHHIHFHMVAKSKDLPAEMKGTGIFAMLRDGEGDAFSRENIARFCADLKQKVDAQPITMNPGEAYAR